MGTEIWVNTGSGNGLVPDDTKPLSEPVLTYQLASDIHLRPSSQEIAQPSFTKSRKEQNKS